uniref:M15 family metallopeptidase n=1 Tax=Ningiella ruwaisensis TaxID=2364274 RepID=UPI0010A07FE9|nr:M15 family metallopeptidase [Ningiella ruwaisensis]
MRALNINHIMGLDNSHLLALSDGHFLLPEVKTAFEKMQAAAAEAYLDLQICSSYRNFERQLSIWNRKWKGELPLYTLEGELLDHSQLSDDEKIHAIMLWSALPGASRHHWGSDLDFYDKQSVERANTKLELVPSEYENDGPCARLSDFIDLHAADFGFYLPYATYVGGVAREPWHISYKPIAEKIQQEFDIDALRKTLSDSELLGKEAVLPQLNELVLRYTYNKGV